MGGLYRPPRRFHPTYTVAESNWLLRRFAYLEERLMETQAGWIHLVAPLEIKIELGRFVYEDALHCDALRTRVAELFSEVDREPRPLRLDGLERVCNEVANAEDLVERLVGLFRVLKGHLVDAYRRYLAAGDDLLDAPTTRILERAVAEEDEHLDWVERVLADLFVRDATAPPRAAAWEAHLQRALEAVGGVMGEEPRGAPPKLRNPGPPPRHQRTLPARDEHIVVVPWAEFAPQPIPPEEATRHLLQQAMSAEIDAAEVPGRVIADFPDLPWKMKLDLARQIWDEVRHADMQWRRLEELGGRPDAAPVALWISEHCGFHDDPLARLIVLQRAAEGRAVDLHRQRVVRLLEEQGDRETAAIFDYILADEKGHVGFSHWINELTRDDPERRRRLLEIQRWGEERFEEIVKRRADMARFGIQPRAVGSA